MLDHPAMGDFPPFVRHRKNRIATSSQYTEGVEGWLFDGADGSQVAPRPSTLTTSTSTCS
jgi:hypothetical protein